MALGTTNITMTAIRDALGEATLKLSELCLSSLINKWARNKPVRGTFPAASDGKYGLDIANNFGYLRPRGLAFNEGYRMGDFRGYEHNRDLAGPVIYVLTGDIDVSASYTPTMADYAHIGEWIAKCNQAPHDSIRILPSDLGIEGFYWGIRLEIGGIVWWKTGALVSATGAGGQEIHFDAKITDLSAKTFADFPSGAIGTWTWTMFISSTQAATWTNWAITPPGSYYNLPGGSGETYGSKTIRSTGTFTMNHWLIAANAAGTIPVSQMTWAYNSIAPQSIYLFKSTGSPNSGVNSSYLIGGYFGGHWNYSAWMGATEVTNDFDAWGDGVEVRLFPTTTNSSAAKSATACFGLEVVDPSTMGEEVQIALTHEDGTPPVFTWRKDDPSYTIQTNTINSGGVIGSSSMNLSIKLSSNPYHPTGITVNIYKDLAETIALHSSEIHFETDGGNGAGAAVVQDYALSDAIDPGDNIVIRLGYAL